MDKINSECELSIKEVAELYKELDCESTENEQEWPPEQRQEQAKGIGHGRSIPDRGDSEELGWA